MIFHVLIVMIQNKVLVSGKYEYRFCFLFFVCSCLLGLCFIWVIFLAILVCVCVFPNRSQVFQLETAMGAAIECFPGAGAVAVPRTRFAPVKKCNDLLLLRSDAYVVNEHFNIVLAPERYVCVLSVRSVRRGGKEGRKTPVTTA